ncbi:MAG TPA: hypothetical protein VGJ15_01575 [Pirellulales bacterium]|jgi:hypothetical protein
MSTNRFLSRHSSNSSRHRNRLPASGRWLGGYDDDRDTAGDDDEDQPSVGRWDDWRFPDDPDDDERFDPEPSPDGYDDFDFDHDADADELENPPDEFWNEAD